MNDTVRRYTLAIVAHIALIAAWYLFVTLGNVPKFVMPSPGATLDALLQPNYNWWANVSATATEIFGGYFLALVGGVALALSGMLGLQALGQEHDRQRRGVLADEADFLAQAAAEAAVAAIRRLPGVILPFPGGIVRAGSKVGVEGMGVLMPARRSACRESKPGAVHF